MSTAKDIVVVVQAIWNEKAWNCGEVDIFEMSVCKLTIQTTKHNKTNNIGNTKPVITTVLYCIVRSALQIRIRLSVWVAFDIKYTTII